VKTLYGLKLPGRRWYQKPSPLLISFSVKQYAVLQVVLCMTSLAARGITVVDVHGDDRITAASSIKLMDTLRASLRKHFVVTNLDMLNCVGSKLSIIIEVVWHEPGPPFPTPSVNSGTT
jgi:hypothetical protein